MRANTYRIRWLVFSLYISQPYLTELNTYLQSLLTFTSSNFQHVFSCSFISFVYTIHTLEINNAQPLRLASKETATGYSHKKPIDNCYCSKTNVSKIKHILIKKKLKWIQKKTRVSRFLCGTILYDILKYTFKENSNCEIRRIYWKTSEILEIHYIIM